MFNLLFGVLLALRFWLLDLKPAHHDESINGWFVIELWKSGNFIYDPTNYHGPLLFYLFQAAEALGGFGVASFRFVTALASVMTLIWLWQWTKKRFDLAGWWLLALAVSPGYLFFSRSAIHEPILILFMVVAATSWVDVWCLKRPERISVFLYGLTGMLLIKETFAITLGLAVICTLPFLIRADKWRALREQKERVIFHAVVCVLIWAAFYSSFGHNPKGLVDFFRAFLPWMKTGTAGNGHEKEFWYFLKMFWSNEPATILALVCAGMGLFKNHWVRWVSLWALLNLLVYSWIPYKTPWCMLAVQMPLWFAAGIVLAKANFAVKWMGQIAMLVLGLMSWQVMLKLNYRELKDPHPYVYVQTSNDTKIFAESLLRQGEEKPSRRNEEILLATEESWPFPWWLSKYPRQASAGLSAWKPSTSILLIDENAQDEAEKKITGEFWKVHFLVRDARIPAVAYLRKSIFECPLEPCQEFSR